MGRRPEGGRQISALLNDPAFKVYQREADGRNGGKFLSKAVLFWEANGPHEKTGAYREREALYKNIGGLQKVIAEVYADLEKAQADLDDMHRELGHNTESG